MKTVQIMLNGEALQLPAQSTVAAALAGRANRQSVRGQARAAFCGMGVCFECRVCIDGQPQQRACQVLVRDGMEVCSG